MKKYLLPCIILFCASCGHYIDYTYWPNKTIQTRAVKNKKTNLYDGRYLAYYESGQKKEERFFKNDCPRKTIAEWYENGNLKTFSRIISIKDSSVFDVIDSFIYKTDIRFIDYVETGYYENGKIAYKGQYHRNRKEGWWTYYNSNSTDIQKKFYLNDTVVK